MTIAGNRKPAPGAVIIGTLSAKTQSRIAAAVPGAVSTPAGTSEATVVDVGSGDARTICKTIGDIVGDEGIVAPLLVDEEGNRLIPTGRFQVRFKDKPTDESLAAFAERHHVRLSKRSKWNPIQVEFRAENNDKRFLLDVAEEIASDRDVASAWPDVWAAFRRESA